MEFSRVRPDVIKYEVRQLSGTPIDQARQHKRGGFARFLSGLGRILGAIAAPLAAFFPPAAIGAAAAYGVSKIGDVGQMRAAQKNAEEAANQQQTMTPSVIPGVDMAMDLARDPVKMFNPLAAGSPRDRQVAQVLLARNEMMMDSVRQV